VELLASFRLPGLHRCLFLRGTPRVAETRFHALRTVLCASHLGRSTSLVKLDALAPGRVRTGFWVEPAVRIFDLGAVQRIDLIDPTGGRIRGSLAAER
jgi:hypothetical protein